MSPRETNERDMDGGRAGTMERVGGWVGVTLRNAWKVSVKLEVANPPIPVTLLISVSSQRPVKTTMNGGTLSAHFLPF